MTRLVAIALAVAMILPGIVTLAHAAGMAPAHRPIIVGTADSPVYLGSMTVVAAALPAAPSKAGATD
jgi:hypothetical protein